MRRPFDRSDSATLARLARDGIARASRDVRAGRCERGHQAVPGVRSDIEALRFSGAHRAAGLLARRLDKLVLESDACYLRKRGG